jgi:hypothetical protein
MRHVELGGVRFAPQHAVSAARLSLASSAAISADDIGIVAQRQQPLAQRRVGNLPALDRGFGPAKAVLGAVRFERRKPGARW